jgi:hypothetical protein
MFEQRIIEMRRTLAESTDLEAAATLTADIARLEKATEIAEELRESPNPAGGGRVRVAPQRANETETEFRARAERELARIEEV